MTECATKLREGTPDQLAHHGLIKLLVEDALHTYTVPLSWEAFRNLTKDDDIKMLAEELTSSSSEEKEHIHTEKKVKAKKPWPKHQRKNKRGNKRKAKLPKQRVTKPH
jgi:hypothetical protein